MQRVMIVEDSKSEATRMQHDLEDHGYEVVWAASGEEGLALASQTQPDVILMDVVMPGLNGFQATRQLKRSVTTKHIPVIIVSHKGQQIDVIWGQRQGAANYLVKPVTPGDLHQAIQAELATVTAAIA